MRPSSGGVFEVTLNGNLIFSKKQLGKFPKDGEVVTFIENLLGIRFLEVYFINYFPVDLRVNWILAICLISILLTILASLYPSRLASKINPAEVLRYE